MAELEKNKPIAPLWFALTLAIVTGVGHLIVKAMQIREIDAGPGYSIGYFIGAMSVAPIVAAVAALVIRPLRSFAGFCLVFAGLSLLALLRGLYG